jgi:hypothetical protein
MQRVIRELSDAIGFGEAIEVVRRWGGRELYVPVKVESGDPLHLTLGLETARKLVAAFGGQRLRLPAERNALLDMRNAAIARDALPPPAGLGLSHEQLGLRYGLTRPAVSQILKAERDRLAFAGQPAAAEP